MPMPPSLARIRQLRKIDLDLLAALIMPIYGGRSKRRKGQSRESLSALCRRGKVLNPVDGSRCHRRKGAGSKGRSTLRRSEAGMPSSSPPTTAAAPGFGVFLCLYSGCWCSASCSRFLRTAARLRAALGSPQRTRRRSCLPLSRLFTLSSSSARTSRTTTCRFVTLSERQRASQSVGDWRFKTSLFGGRLLA
eukprot:COSAG06_NODE_906_length_11624_cov_6.452321_4_plen_192_part_00